MKNNLYYTPTISEFYVGFECEVLGLIGAKEDEKLFSQPTIISQKELLLIDRLEIRVKYLDQSDIESLGWSTEDNGECYNLQIKWDLYGLYPFEFESKIPHTYKISKDRKDLFYGTIKNKSELIKLMKQLNIKNNENKK